MITQESRNALDALGERLKNHVPALLAAGQAGGPGSGSGLVTFPVCRPGSEVEARAAIDAALGQAVTLSMCFDHTSPAGLAGFVMAGFQLLVTHVATAWFGAGTLERAALEAVLTEVLPVTLPELVEISPEPLEWLRQIGRPALDAALKECRAELQQRVRRDEAQEMQRILRESAEQLRRQQQQQQQHPHSRSAPTRNAPQDLYDELRKPSHGNPGTQACIKHARTLMGLGGAPCGGGCGRYHYPTRAAMVEAMPKAVRERL